MNKFCPKCNKYFDISQFNKNCAQKDGLENYCRKCSRIKSKKYYEKNRNKIKKKYNKYKKYKYNKAYREKNRDKILEKQKEYAKSSFGKFQQYRRNALKRGIFFNISYEKFCLFWEKPCFYCGMPIKNISIDRIHNQVGYVFNNCVSCCEICNRLKLDLSFEDWTFKIEQILNFQLYHSILIKNEDINFLKDKYYKYKYRAKNKNMDFCINKLDFLKILKKPCFYCGTIDYRFSTIDRMDNQKGYIYDNCLSCCKYCNSGKRNRKIEEFLFWMERLTNFKKTALRQQKFNKIEIHTNNMFKMDKGEKLWPK